MSNVERLEDIGHAMMLAWGRIKKAQARMWGDWMTIGEGLLEGRRWAMQRAGTNKPEGKGYVMAYGEWLARYKVDDLDKSDRAKLLQLMTERAAVEEWRATLTDYERRNLNNPVIAWRKWTAATRVKKIKPREPAETSPIALAHKRVELEERVKELEEELDARAPLTLADHVNALLWAEPAELAALDLTGLIDKLAKVKQAGVITGEQPDADPDTPDNILRHEPKPSRAARVKWSRLEDGMLVGQPGEYFASRRDGEYAVFQNVIGSDEPVEIGTAKNAAEVKALVQAHADSNPGD